MLTVIVIYQQKTGHGYRVEWHDISEVYLVSESTGSKLAQKIGLGGERKLFVLPVSAIVKATTLWYSKCQKKHHLYADVYNIYFDIPYCKSSI